jgi:hypothetical protein
MAAFCIAVVTVRVFVSGRAEYVAGEAKLAQGDTAEAIVRFRRAARWYAPGNPYSTRALDRLTEIATRAEAAGDIRVARRAWEGVRGAILATRSTYTPNGGRLESTNQHIAALLAREEGPVDGKSEPERTAWHLAVLTRDDAPRVSWTLLALAGFVGWIGGAFAFIYRGIGDDDRLRPRAALRAAILVVAGYAAFFVGLARA